MSLKLYNPDVFQGNLNLSNYFEGWYFKNVSFNADQVYSFIPGISLSDDDPHSFIQIMNGITGSTVYVRYNLEEFTWDNKRMYVKIGKSVFTENYIGLNIADKEITVEGQLNYSQHIKYPRSIISPGIMGWYSFVPFMECKHGIVSVKHTIAGTIRINGNSIDFSNGKGYIEKDWGTSFPEAWIWIHSNNFKEADSSFTFSVAKIPWLGNYFLGLIAFLYCNQKFYLFSTYNRSSISDINRNNKTLNITLKNKRNILKINVRVRGFGDLLAPVSGHMSRRIKESIDSEVGLTLFDNHNNLIYQDTGIRAGVEIIDKIFDYLKPVSDDIILNT